MSYPAKCNRRATGPTLPLAGEGPTAEEGPHAYVDSGEDEVSVSPAQLRSLTRTTFAPSVSTICLSSNPLRSRISPGNAATAEESQELLIEL